jgi:glycogen debranching enzyme
LTPNRGGAYARAGMAFPWLVASLLLGVTLGPVAPRGAEAGPLEVPRFPLGRSGLELARPAQRGRFLDVVGRRSALFGYETGPLEAWVYPLKIVDDLSLSFRLQDYPVEILAEDVTAAIAVRPEATVITYSHAAFTVREILFAPVDEPGLVVLLDVESVLPLTITGSFRPKLRLMWPAGLMTPNLEWDETAHVYYLTEESKRFVGILGSPTARDLSVMPYQEEPKDAPIRFTVEVPVGRARSSFVPIVIAGSVTGRDQAKAVYDGLVSSIPALYARNVGHYRTLLEQTTSIATPDPRLDESFAWAKVGIDKGLATSPQLGTGLLAGFRTSGDSERPGFGWFFGRDALWTALAIHSYGDFAAARQALDFLMRVQRADGKIPHEISQSAFLIPWFTDYPYPWNSADATPLYVIAHADHWRATGDRELLDRSYESIVKAWRFTAATDTDGNGLVENTKFGHGWVEGGDLYPAHEEIYQQGVWIEACRSLAEMAEVRGEAGLAREARERAERTRSAVEKTYWLADRGFYGFATALPREKPEADRGPERARRQARLEILAKGGLVDEDTVLPAVPLWWNELDEARAQAQIDRLGSGRIATDWGARLLSDESDLYDPLSYHHGSVWPLFTGWSAMAAYGYGRPHVGYQALMANALLLSRTALGYVTELLSGDFLAAFGRSSHHQIWSEAMVVTPTVRGLFGIAPGAGGHELRFAPQLPADWDRAAIRNVAVGGSLYDFDLRRTPGRDVITATRRGGAGISARLTIAPGYPLDAAIRAVSVDGHGARFELKKEGDIQRPEIVVEGAGAKVLVVIRYSPGSDAYLAAEAPATGARSEGLRILRSHAQAGALALTLEGLGGRSYPLRVRSPRRVEGTTGATVRPRSSGDFDVEVAFDGASGVYARRQVVLPLR